MKIFIYFFQINICSVCVLHAYTIVEKESGAALRRYKYSTFKEQMSYWFRICLTFLSISTVSILFLLNFSYLFNPHDIGWWWICLEIDLIGKFFCCLSIVQLIRLSIALYITMNAFRLFYRQWNDGDFFISECQPVNTLD